MTRFKKCVECGSAVSNPPHYIRFKMAKVGQTEKGKETICKDCYQEWKDHERDCDNPPGECFSIIRESHNMLTILDARKDAYDHIKMSKRTDNYYDL